MPSKPDADSAFEIQRAMGCFDEAGRKEDRKNHGNAHYLSSSLLGLVQILMQVLYMSERE